MNQHDSKSDSGIQEVIRRGIAGYMVLLVFCFAALPFVYLSEVKNVKGMRALALTIGLIGLFVSKFTVPQVLKLQSEDPSLSFRLALYHTIYAYIGLLCFIPIIGPVVHRVFIEKKDTNPFTVTDDHSKDA